jgi:site-specific recombinase XerD
MSNANVSVFIDQYHPQKDGNCKVSIRITHQRKRRYYPTNLAISAKDFDRIMTAKRRNDADTKTYNKILSFENKAIEAVDALPVFTFGMFEDIYLNNKNAGDSVKFGFEKYVQELKDEKRIGTAVSYETAMKSIDAFKTGLKYADITASFLKKYENAMIDAGKSKTTVGIYLRSLRAIYNRATIDKALYPFGVGKNKYSIPTGRNIKKALKIEEIAKIFHYEVEAGTTKAMARDYWIFIYLCNGLNVKDLCLLKHKNIEGDVLKYERAKTKRSKKDSDLITVSLKPEAKTIMSKWGQHSINGETYIFPHLQKGMTAERERIVYKQLTKIINHYMKLIAKELEINKQITTYYARHSFATILKNSGASMEFISEALGHGDMKTTKSYDAGFEHEIIHKTTDALTAFAK